MTWRTGPLANHPFRLLAAGQFTSTLGDFCYAVALPWLVLSARGGPLLLGAVLACYGVPRMALIPVGGLLADRFSARSVMLAADITRAVAVAVLAYFGTRHVASLALLGPIAAVIGAGEGVFLPASMAILPNLIPGEQLQAGNAISMGLTQLGALAGPALGGALVAASGSAPAFAVDAATFVVSALTLAAISARAAGAAGAAGAGPADGQDGDGTAGAHQSIWSLLRASRVLRILLLLVLVANFAFAGAFEVALPVLAHDRFGAGGYGALMASLGFGALVGTLCAARQATRFRPATLAMASFVLGGAVVSLLPFLGGLPGAAVAAFAFGGSNAFGNITMITSLQRWAPPNLLGRVMSLVMLAAMGTYPAAVILAGALVRGTGPAPFFPIAGSVLALVICLGATQREMRHFGAATGQRPDPGEGPELAGGQPEPAV